MNEKSDIPLKKGWTTGACATAALKAALSALVSGEFENTVCITLPKGENVEFELKYKKLNVNENFALAAIVKDAGDDPDITHGAVIIAQIEKNVGKHGVMFKAGRGVGIVAKPGLPIDVGQPAITPVPKLMMEKVVEEICVKNKFSNDLIVTIAIENGEEMARQTWNPRLGIVGGLSVLGTTGVVHPYSCSAWIHSLHRGIDVARAEGAEHVIAATGSTSQEVAQKIYKLPDTRCLDMGDFVGGVIKYIRKYPVKNLTIAGGFAKMVKLSQGEMDLHSQRSQVDFVKLADKMIGVDQKTRELVEKSTSAASVLEISQKMKIDLPKAVGEKALEVVRGSLRDAEVKAEIIIVNRVGEMLAHVK